MWEYVESPCFHHGTDWAQWPCVYFIIREQCRANRRPFGIFDMTLCVPKSTLKVNRVSQCNSEKRPNCQHLPEHFRVPLIMQFDVRPAKGSRYLGGVSKGVFINGWTDHSSGTCWLSSMSSASPPLRVMGALLRAAATLICLWGVGTFFGTVGDVLMGPWRKKHTHRFIYSQLFGWMHLGCVVFSRPTVLYVRRQIHFTLEMQQLIDY